METTVWPKAWHALIKTKQRLQAEHIGLLVILNYSCIKSCWKSESQKKNIRATDFCLGFESCFPWGALYVMLELLILIHPKLTLKRRNSRCHHHSLVLFLCRRRLPGRGPGRWVPSTPPSRPSTSSDAAACSHPRQPATGAAVGLHRVSAPQAFSTCELRQVILKQPESSSTSIYCLRPSLLAAWLQLEVLNPFFLTFHPNYGFFWVTSCVFSAVFGLLFSPP